jgi:hypothetical protein
METTAGRDRVLAVASYAIVALVCLARLEGVFTFRDLSWTDTEVYYRASSRWLGQGLLTVDRAPLYVLLLSIARMVVDDATIVVPAHRVIAALVLALALLALFRRLFPAAIALVLASWAAVVPTQFDGLYEVHLVAAGACAIAAWAATYGERRGGRACVLGLLLVFSLIRSELAAAALAWSIACALYEVRLRRPGDAPASLRSVLFPYVIPPLALALVLLVTFAAGVWAPRFRTPKTIRHFCNAYALGVAEREGLPPGATWKGCKRILRRDFGRDNSGPLAAFVRSPRALLGHVAWNLRLMPATAELMLWGATGAARGSDYVPVPTGSRAARGASIVLVVLIVAGLARGRPHAGSRLEPRRRWALVGLAALLATSLAVLVASRARAQYLAPVGIAMSVLIGKALEALWPTARSRAAEFAVIGLALCAVPFVPARFDAAYATPLVGRGQPTVVAVRRLGPYRGELASESVRLGATRRPPALCRYLGCATGTCTGVQVGGLLAIDQPAVLDRELRKLGITHLYLDEQRPGGAGRRLASAGGGWRRVAPPGEGEPWVLLRAEPLRAPSGVQDRPRDLSPEHEREPR